MQPLPSHGEGARTVSIAPSRANFGWTELNSLICCHLHLAENGLSHAPTGWLVPTADAVQSSSSVRSGQSSFGQRW